MSGNSPLLDTNIILYFLGGDDTLSIRRKYNMKLPDAIIAATSVSLDVPIITADNDFKKVKNSNLIFYEK